MSHNHKHSCSCDHKNVKYCSTCQVVHCLDCNQEWTKRNTWNWTVGTTTYPFYGYRTAEVHGNTTGSSDWQKTVDTMLTSTCSHGG